MNSIPSAANNRLSFEVNFLAPSMRDLCKWLSACAVWANNPAPDIEAMPKCLEAKAPTESTVRFVASLRCSSRDLFVTLTQIHGMAHGHDAASGKDFCGTWSFAPEGPPIRRKAAVAPEFFHWIEDARFLDQSALIAGLYHAAQAALTAEIKNAGGYGAFTAFKNENVGTVRFQAYFQLGSTQRLAEMILEAAKKIEAGETSHVLDSPAHRWTVELCGFAVSEIAEAEPVEATNPDMDMAPAVETKTESADLPAEARSENQSPRRRIFKMRAPHPARDAAGSLKTQTLKD